MPETAGWPGNAVESGILATLLADASQASEYAWLLGAGASFTSGAALAGTILRDTKRKLFVAVHGHPPDDDDQIEAWLKREGRLQDPDRAYGEALEWLLPQPRLRRRALFEHLKDAVPSPGYVALAQLARQDLVRVVLTTNFDDLLQQAFATDHRVKLRVVAHDQPLADSEWPPKVPTLLKLHGDFLFDSLRNTPEELNALATLQADRLRRSAEEGGLVVVGFRGADESVMSVLESLSEVPLGLYWLHRGNEPPHPRVARLLERSWAYSVVIEGFDQFLALVASRAGTNTIPSLSPGRLPNGRSSGRFVSGERIGGLLRHVGSALESTNERVCVITGRPGVGKTTLARHAADERSESFHRVVALTAQRRSLDLAAVLDFALGELGLAHAVDVEVARGRFLDAMAARPVLLLLDNLDAVDQEVASLLGAVPAPSRALATVRDPAGLRAAGVEFREVRHEGLSTAELREILQLHAAASPRVAQRLRALGDVQVERLLERLHGWPQALKLVIGRLEEPVADVASAERLVGETELFAPLLKEGFEALAPDARRVLVASASYAATVTPQGAARVAAISLSRARAGLGVLLERQWLAELASETYVYAHPLITEFVRSVRDRGRQGHRRRAQEHLQQWLARYGGQPDPDWANFRALDREAENVRAALEDALSEGALKRMTDIMQPAFPYFVERGHWTATDLLARRVLAADPSAAVRAEWLVWRSWLALYLRRDPQASADFAEAALATGTNRLHPRFEAHRRALTALSRTGDYASARDHAARADALRPRLGARDADPGIDLLNAIAGLDVAEGSAAGRPELVERGLSGYREAYRLCSARGKPNTRELAVAMIGEARALHVLGQSEEALRVAQRAGADAGAIGWLRGLEDAYRLVADLANELGRSELAESAAAFARSTGDQLRHAT